MPNKLTSKQPEVLSHEACDKFQETHKEVAVSCWGTGESKWEVYDQVGYDSPLVSADDVKSTTSEISRQAAITAYWQEYDKDWTPPACTEPRSVIHDEKWALEYARQHSLCFGKGRVWEAAYSNNGVSIDDGLTTVGTVLKWKARYDPDKPTREETAVELLGEVVKADRIGCESLVRALNNAREFIAKKEADYVD